MTWQMPILGEAKANLYLFFKSLYMISDAKYDTRLERLSMFGADECISFRTRKGKPYSCKGCPIYKPCHKRRKNRRKTISVKYIAQKRLINDKLRLILQDKN